ncbi:unnamed protein product [Xylocopa violacea]|uniref:Uncharacterized protein n=1 Tax=Xylocopa violacea TaxID=135666 RepID=A0ABP1N6J8_XYLVO
MELAPAGPDCGIRAMPGSLPSVCPASSHPSLAIVDFGPGLRGNKSSQRRRGAGRLSVSSDSERNRIRRDWNLRTPGVYMLTYVRWSGAERSRRARLASCKHGRGQRPKEKEKNQS